VGTAHGETATQDPRGLPSLPRHHPRAATNRDTHGVITGEPDARKRARPVRAGGRWKRTRTSGYLANGLPVPRAIVGHRWGFAEDTVRLAAALRPALAARGVPDYVYVDNGSAFVDSWLLRACAKLGIKLVHSAPGRPQGRGKIERFFRTVNGEFVVEIAAGDGEPGRQVSDLAEMNRLFTAWVETVYHRRVHSETAAAPLPRWLDGGPYPVPAPADLAEAFRWSEHRTVSKTALVSLHGNRYQVNPGLVGRKVELVFDPFDLTFLRVRLDGSDAGTALPFQISRHSHPKAKPEIPAEPPKPTTGIDYLGLIDSTHTAELATKVNYAALGANPPEPAALELDLGLELPADPA
jgi:putative transposase